MERERLTITLKRDILKLVDQSIDGAKLRNRSHAIEYFLSRELSPKSVKVVLAVPGGGMSTSYQAANMPIGVRGTTAEGMRSADLKSIFQILASQNFRDIILVGTDSTSLEAAAVDAEKLELEAKTEVVDVSGGEVGPAAFSKLADLVKDETFIYWDTRFTGDINLADFLDFHKAAQGEATSALATNKNLAPVTGAAAAVYGRRISTVNTKNAGGADGLPVVGVHAFEPQVLSALQGKNKDLYNDILPAIAREGKLNGFVFTATEAVKQPAMATAGR